MSNIKKGDIVKIKLRKDNINTLGYTHAMRDIQSQIGRVVEVIQDACVAPTIYRIQGCDDNNGLNRDVSFLANHFELIESKKETDHEKRLLDELMKPIDKTPMQYEEILQYIKENYDDSFSDNVLRDDEKDHIFYRVAKCVDAKTNIIEVTKPMAEVLFGLGYDLVNVYEKTNISSSGMANDPFNSLKIRSNNYIIYVMKRLIKPTFGQD